MENDTNCTFEKLLVKYSENHTTLQENCLQCSLKQIIDFIEIISQHCALIKFKEHQFHRQVRQTSMLMKAFHFLKNLNVKIPVDTYLDVYPQGNSYHSCHPIDILHGNNHFHGFSHKLHNYQHNERHNLLSILKANHNKWQNNCLLEFIFNKMSGTIFS